MQAFITFSISATKPRLRTKRSNKYLSKELWLNMSGASEGRDSVFGCAVDKVGINLTVLMDTAKCGG